MEYLFNNHRELGELPIAITLSLMGIDTVNLIPQASVLWDIVLDTKNEDDLDECFDQLMHIHLN